MEWSQYIEANQHLSKLSQRTYETNYRKLRGGLNELHRVTEQAILDYLDAMLEEQQINANTYQNLLSVSTQVRKHFNVPVKQLVRQKVVVNERIAQLKKTNNAQQIEKGITENDLINHLNQRFANEEWRDFIILFLLINYHTRNKDLNLVIVPSMRHAKDETKNYLVVCKSYTTLIRNDFKTASKYGTKKDKIVNSKFRYAMKSFVEERGGLESSALYLCATGTNKQVADDSVQKYIAHKTLDKMGQSAYNKVIVSTAVKNKDITKLREISSRRGTSLEILLDFYNLQL